MFKRKEDKYWDFKTANTKEFTHCYHTYPAMMIPQVARTLIEQFAPEGKLNLLFDPYMGSGTSLVEASIKGIDSIGTDINPLARLISKSKVTKVNINNIKSLFRDFEKYIISDNNIDLKKPNINNIDFWFKEKQINDLLSIKYFIDEIKDEDEKDFFLVPFSETLREVSLTRNGEFKLYRIPKEKIDTWNPNTIELFKEKVNIVLIVSV